MVTAIEPIMKLTAEDYDYKKVGRAPDPAPLEPPPFTLKDIKAAIPPHCFERSIPISMFYFIKDVVQFFGFLYLAILIIPNLSSPALRILAWPIYWYFQILAMSGLGTIGHECAHGAFSEHQWFNNIFGNVAHSLILIPYENWRTSHRKHHLNAGNMDHDEVFVPPKRSQVVSSKVIQSVEGSKIYNYLTLVLTLFTGWMPLYLIYNFSGPTKNNDENINHFDPSAKWFRPYQWKELIVSNIAYAIVVMALMGGISVFGLGNVIFYYGIPYIFFNAGLVVSTALHHTDTFVPHYKGDEWTYLRGSLATVDRSYGLVEDHFMHYINDTHVMHHIFPHMPFYHCHEATEAARKVLGKYYLRDKTPIIFALFRAVRHCRFVDDDKDIVFYQSSVKDNLAGESGVRLKSG